MAQPSLKQQMWIFITTQFQSQLETRWKIHVQGHSLNICQYIPDIGVMMMLKLVMTFNILPIFLHSRTSGNLFDTVFQQAATPNLQ